jgi:uncharacterized membrane protein (UPF0182 family)
MTFPRPDFTFNRPKGKNSYLLISIGALFIALLTLSGYYTDWLWYKSVSAQSVYLTVLAWRIGLFVFFAGITGFIIWLNVHLAYKYRPMYATVTPDQISLQRYREALDPIRKSVFIFGPILLGFLAGGSASAEWRSWVQRLNSVPFGVNDPQFGMDLSFFIFDYPLYRNLVTFGISTIVLAGIASGIIHYIYGGITLQSQTQKATKFAQSQVSILVALLFILKAFAYWLDRFGLALKQDPLLVGLKYADVNAVLPAKSLMMYLSLIVAVLFIINAFRRKWFIPNIGIGALLVTGILIGGVYATVVQQFVVRPSEADREAPYIQKSITATREAYGLSGVEVSDYPASTVADLEVLAQQTETIKNIRLMDPALISATFNQLQQIRGFYSFADTLDIDRYPVNGSNQGTVIAAREINLVGIPNAQRNWINSHLVYTHGFGVVTVKDNAVKADGEPEFTTSDIPTKGSLKIDQPRIYFGENSPSYSIVGGAAGSEPRELDYPDDTSPNGQANNTYSGTGGVPIGNFFNRALYALKYQEINIILSNLVNNDSKVLYYRDPAERVQRVAPWLILDGDPYPAVIDGKITWMLDGYTATNFYPYSTRTSLNTATADSLNQTSTALRVQSAASVNYVRNSVKATVDAYDGTVSIYAWDESEPILKSWSNAFPGTVKPRSAMPAEVVNHVRYPEDLFKIQREILSKYHVKDAGAFYGGQDFWIIPNDPTRPGVQSAQPPYYLQLQMPGDVKPVFSLTTTFAPTRRQTLASFMSVSSDPSNNYGKIRVLQLPRNTTIPGPTQVQNNFESNPDVGALLSLLRRGGSDVELGNLLSLPIAGGLLYVEPVYVRATAGESYPLLRKVLASFGQKVVFEDNIEDAISALFGTSAGATTGPEEPSSTDGQATPTPEAPSITGNPEIDLANAISDMQKAVADGKKALAEGDFTAYGKAQQDLENALDRALDAQNRLNANTAIETTPEVTPASFVR